MKSCRFLFNSMSPFSRKKVYGGETEQQEQVICVPMIFVPQELFIAKQHFQLKFASKSS